MICMLLLSVVAGIIGTYIVVRRMVFVAGGITHASFGGIGIAYYFGLSPIVGAFVFAIATALSTGIIHEKGRVREDSAIAILWSLGMAIGVLFMFLTPGYAPNLLGYMFGDVLAVSSSDVVALAIMAVVTVVGAVVFYRPILYISFSTSFARLTGWNTRLINAVLSVFVAVALVLAIKIVGIILVLSIFTIPQCIANIFTKNMAKMMVLSSVIALIASATGLVVAFAFDLPVGAVVTALLAVVFLIVRVARNISMKINKEYY